jgi:16S rRNA (cytosine1402-N4)-methyltransferase
VNLADLLAENSDEPYADAIARALIGQSVDTTVQLADRVRGALAETVPAASRPQETRKALQRTFQALRIAVNDEFHALEQFLTHLPDCLEPGGRVAILSFHSGEDRRVKKSFQAGHRDGVYARVAPDLIRPSADERRDNPRSSGAKLRWAVRAAPASELSTSL